MRQGVKSSSTEETGELKSSNTEKLIERNKTPSQQKKRHRMAINRTRPGVKPSNTEETGELKSSDTEDSIRMSRGFHNGENARVESTGFLSSGHDEVLHNVNWVKRGWTCNPDYPLCDDRLENSEHILISCGGRKNDAESPVPPLLANANVPICCRSLVSSLWSASVCLATAVRHISVCLCFSMLNQSARGFIFLPSSLAPTIYVPPPQSTRPSPDLAFIIRLASTAALLVGLLPSATLLGSAHVLSLIATVPFFFPGSGWSPRVLAHRECKRVPYGAFQQSIKKT
ncbi:hypothetical protein Cgig2_004897 [Carnegiea gigantea]|uniref:Uncharacterized protein n=1 Tax=Carnegiea gigantea TaxID=171969 RepID=A0A9Q1KXD4_9CARY|nr:hypothetical protein Cgig2_004897 [Carnegiea gigantea]